MAGADQGFTVREGAGVNLGGESAEKAEDSVDASGGAGTGRSLPPVDFSGFVLGLGQMTLIHLGEVAEPGSGQVSRDLDQARHAIDLLDMLESKTRGNLSDEEASLLRHLLSDLKIRYVRYLR